MQKIKKMHNGKRGFTLTELAIVIAVIAVLIAVLVPTFVVLLNNAKESVQMQEAKNINTTLSTGSATEGTPTNIGEVIDILVADGYSEELTTNSSDTEYIWVKDDNTIVVYNFAENTSIYPEDYSIAGKTYCYFSANSTVNNGFAAGDGKSADTAYEIATLSQLESLRTLMLTDNATQGVYFQLDRDLKLSNTWTPLGTMAYVKDSDNYVQVIANDGKAFQGTFDGNGCTITITDSKGVEDYSDYALFANVYGTSSNPTTIKNLNIVMEVYDDNSYSCAGVAGYVNGDVSSSVIFENITVSGTITSKAYAGGIVGWETHIGTFINCVNYANIITTYCNNSDSTNLHTFIGGICAQSNSYSGREPVYTNCENKGTLRSTYTGTSSINVKIGDLYGTQISWSS